MTLDESSTAAAPASVSWSLARIAVEVAAVVVMGVALRTLASAVVVAGMGQPSGGFLALAGLLDLRLILWAGLMVAVEWWLRGAPIGRRIRFLVLATLVTAVVGLLASDIVAQISEPGSFTVLLIPGAINAVGFALCGIVACITIPPVLAARVAGDRRPWRGVGIVIGVLLVAGFALIGSTLLQIFSLTFSIEGAPRPPTPDQVSRLQLTAWLAVGFLFAAAVIGFALRRRALAITGLVLFLLALPLLVLIRAPQLNLPSPAAPTVAPEPATGCYSGSGDCPGG